MPLPARLAERVWGPGLFYRESIVQRNSLELLRLLGDATAEAMEDGADTAHKREDAPKQRAAENMRQARLGIGQEQDSPGNKISADDNTAMTEDQRRHPSPIERQINQRRADDQWNDSARAH